MSAMLFRGWLALFMYRLFTWLMIRLIPACLLLIALPPAAGRVLVEADARLARYGFAVCALPCWLNIHPGQTSLADAVDYIRHHLPQLERLARVSHYQTYFYSDTYKEMSGILFQDRHLAGGYEINADLPLGFLVEAMGEPDCVWIIDRSPLLRQTAAALYWEDGEISAKVLVVTRDRTAWRPLTGVRSLRVDTIRYCHRPITQPWRGFVALWRYDADL